MTEPFYDIGMTIAMVVGLISGGTFLASWAFFHGRYRKVERRRWTWARIDALLWVAVLTGFWLHTLYRVKSQGGWPYPGGVTHQIVILTLSTAGSVALATRLVWWLHELAAARRAVRSNFAEDPDEA